MKGQKMKLYGIKDKVFGIISVNLAENKMAALRAFSDQVNAKDQQGRAIYVMGNHPDDFSLYELGDFDQKTGNVTPDVKFIEEATLLFKKD